MNAVRFWAWTKTVNLIRPLYKGNFMTKYEKIMQVLSSGRSVTAKQLAKKASTTTGSAQARISEMRANGYNVMCRTVNANQKEYYLDGLAPSKSVAKVYARNGAPAFLAA